MDRASGAIHNATSEFRSQSVPSVFLDINDNLEACLVVNPDKAYHIYHIRF